MATLSTFIIFVSLFSFCVATSTVQQRQAFKTCMKGKQRIGQLSEDAIAHCRKLARQNQPPNTIQENDAGRDVHQHITTKSSEEMAFKYFKNLGMWKNGLTELGTGLLDEICSCWRRSESVKEKWTSLFEKRKDNEVAMLKVVNQRWTGEEGIASFAPISKKLHMQDLTAGELILHRVSPSKIGENFGRYRTAVYSTWRNVSKSRIHADFQSACPSTKGNIMMLDLDLQNLVEWRIAGDQLLKLHIRVLPRRQYIAGGMHTATKTRISVVEQVVGLVLHFTQPKEDISPHLARAFVKPSVRSDGMSENDLPKLVPIENNEAQADAIKQDGNDDIMKILLGTGTSSNEKSTVNRVSARAKRSVEKSNRSRQRRVPANTRPPPTAATRTPRKCRRMSHRLSPNAYRRLRIRHPEYEDEMFDIGECMGDCPRSLASANLNVTYHTVAISESLGTNPDLTVCCVPHTYKNVYYTGYSDEEYFFQKILKNLKANSCACR
ncbi:uncharacterized protein LOC120336487 [Styela clava]